MDNKYFKDVDTIVKNMYNGKEGLSWSMGMDYGCALSKYHGIRKERYKDRVVEAFKKVFINDPNRLNSELCDLDHYSNA